MKKTLVVLATALALLICPAAASAYNLGPQQATNECRSRTTSMAQSTLGTSSVIFHGATAAVFYGNGDWAIRGRWMRQDGGPYYALWVDCRLQGNNSPDGYMQNAAFALAWPAPNYIVGMQMPWSTPMPCTVGGAACANWNEMNRILSPFAHPDNGTAW